MTKPFVIPKALIWNAFQRVKANGGSAGVDEESIDAFEKSLGDNLYKLWNRMGSGSYFPPPVKAVPIPKKSGGTRMLGVPTVADRVAQTVVKLVLEPALEPVFDRDSFGYRPGRSALDAVALVSGEAGTMTGWSSSTSKVCSTTLTTSFSYELCESTAGTRGSFCTLSAG
jgi:RNA-directed DNA polymerase